MGAGGNPREFGLVKRPRGVKFDSAATLEKGEGLGISVKWSAILENTL